MNSLNLLPRSFIELVAEKHCSQHYYQKEPKLTYRVKFIKPDLKMYLQGWKAAAETFVKSCESPKEK